MEAQEVKARLTVDGLAVGVFERRETRPDRPKIFMSCSESINRRSRRKRAKGRQLTMREFKKLASSRRR